MYRTRSLAITVAAVAGLLAGIPAEAQVDRSAVQRFVDERMDKHMQRREAAIARARQLGFPVRRRMPDGKVVAVKKVLDGRLIYYTTDNIDAADTISSDEVWSGGSLGTSLDGSGQVLGIWDAGNARATHQEFSGRVTQVETVGDDDHATHVAGTMIAGGVVPGAKGMSGAAMLRSWDWGLDEIEMATEQQVANPVLISNHSYSYITGWTTGFAGCYRGCGCITWTWFSDVAVSVNEDPLFGFYDESSKDWDQIAFDSPAYLMVKSAGNDRDDSGAASGSRHIHYDSNGPSGPGYYCTNNDSHPADGGVSGYDTIAGGSASAKNIITVGAVQDISGGYTGTGDVNLASFSSAGPTDDGRIKPDIVANGWGLYSSTSGHNSDYATYSGTSMSSPSVAGSLGLLTQHAENLFGSGFRFRSSTIKALVLHTADEAGSSPGPDYLNGWGLMNTKTAAQVMSDDADSTKPEHIRELRLDNGETETLEIYSDGGGPLKVTIAWIDPPGTPPPLSVDPVDLMLVNDLDLRVTSQSATTYQPWVLDPANPASAATTGDNFRDNIEQVVIASPTAGLYTISITHKSTLQDSAPQLFSLIVTGNQNIPSDLDGDLMPNSFENSNGLDQLDPTDAALDPDGDGLTNLQEFQSETDPGDSDSDDDGVRDGLDPYPAESQDTDDNYCDEVSDGIHGEVSGQMISSSQVLICADPDGVDVGGESSQKVEVMDTGVLIIVTPGATEFFPGDIVVSPGGNVLLYTEPLP